jgi:hypothetical protein
MYGIFAVLIGMWVVKQVRKRRQRRQRQPIA